MAKKNKFNELSVGELKTKLMEMDKELVVLMMKKKQRALKDYSVRYKIKKDMARAHTFLNAKKVKDA